MGKVLSLCARTSPCMLGVCIYDSSLLRQGVDGGKKILMEVPISLSFSFSLMEEINKSEKKDYYSEMRGQALTTEERTEAKWFWEKLTGPTSQIY